MVVDIRMVYIISQMNTNGITKTLYGPYYWLVYNFRNQKTSPHPIRKKLLYLGKNPPSTISELMERWNKKVEKMKKVGKPVQFDLHPYMIEMDELGKIRTISQQPCMQCGLNIDYTTTSCPYCNYINPVATTET